MTSFIFILSAILLVLLNGFFVAAEFALVKLRVTQVQTIRELYGVRGRILEKVHSRLDVYLSACQLGITLASLGLGWIGEPAFASLLEPLLRKIGIVSPTMIEATSFLLAFFIISYLHIVAGELAPKSLAIRQSRTISLWTALPLYFFYWVMYPFIWLLNKSANFVLCIFGASDIQEAENKYTSEELKLILSASHQHGELKKEEAEILDNVLDFTDLIAADIMHPFDELISLSLNKPDEENLKTIARHHYSRYPVYQENPQKIIGLLHVKDLFAAQMQSPSPASLKEAVRPILIISTQMPATELFHQFRAGLTHFAIVKNEDEVLVGFISLDDILSALLGRIDDEFIKSKESFTLGSDGSLLMKGNTPLYILEKALQIDLPQSLEANTISGILLTYLERMPLPNEKVSFKWFDIIVVKMTGQRILMVKVYPKKL